jgi:hypothetical protein
MRGEAARVPCCLRRSRPKLRFCQTRRKHRGYIANVPSCFGAFDPSITARSVWGRKANGLQTGSAIAVSDAVVLQQGG